MGKEHGNKARAYAQKTAFLFFVNPLQGNAKGNPCPFKITSLQLSRGSFKTG
ncbi:Hypothetical protein Minf_1911 [Methylacidiphilum infernorum V4]|uniref:Uncharacterized protein n=1 Tax=Methylacidiphilum infernorum (isolate V4) TaxID=481448 RepID=B3DY13_METI4|nr:Hypothetical protein Minf_1911 [Methylacidiphilum infernorum V4]